MPYKKHFGEQVRKLRLEQKLSQEKFCRIADINQSNLSAIERGYVNVKLDTIHKIAQGLDVKIPELFVSKD